MMMLGDLRRTRRFEHPPEVVWKAITSAAAARVWLGASDLRARVGHTFTVELSRPFAEVDQVECEVLEVHAPHRLVLAWRHGESRSVVELEVRPRDRGSVVTIRHRGLGRLSAWLVGAWLLVRWDRALASTPGAIPVAPMPVWIGGTMLTTSVMLALLAWPDGPQPPGVAEAPAREVADLPPSVSDQPRPDSVAVPQASEVEASVQSTPGPDLQVAEAEGVGDAMPTGEAFEEVLSALARSRASRRPTSERRDTSGEARPRRDKARERGDVEPAPEPAGQAQVRVARMPWTLNPLYAESSIDQHFSELVFDSLFEVGASGVESHLVRSYTTDGTGRHIEVELRRDVRWHDGERMKAEDVCQTLEWFVDPALDSPHADHWRDRVKSCEVRARKAHLQLTRSWDDPRRALDLPLLPSHLTYAPSIHTQFSQRPIGTGPLMAKRAPRQLRLVAARNASRRARIAELVVVGGSDVRQQRHELEEGSADLVVGFDGAHLADFQPGPGALYPLAIRTRLLAFDTSGGPTADLAFRSALLEAAGGLDEAAAMEQAGAERTLGRWSMPDGRPATVSLGVVAGFSDEAFVRELQNRWGAAGFDVRVSRVALHRLGNPAELRERFDALLSSFDASKGKHPVAALVEPGRGNPFGVRSAKAEQLLNEQGEEYLATWLAVADTLEDEVAVELLGSQSTWIAIGPRVEANDVPQDDPLDALPTWTLRD